MSSCDTCGKKNNTCNPDEDYCQGHSEGEVFIPNREPDWIRIDKRRMSTTRWWWTEAIACDDDRWIENICFSDKEEVYKYDIVKSGNRFIDSDIHKAYKDWLVVNILLKED